MVTVATMRMIHIYFRSKQHWQNEIVALRGADYYYCFSVVCAYCVLSVAMQQVRAMPPGLYFFFSANNNIE